MVSTIKINGIETDNNSQLIALNLNENRTDLALYDKSTLQAVGNCNLNFERSNVCREKIMQSLNELSEDILKMGISFTELEQDISNQLGGTQYEL